jgi:Flp pilus assembly protein protease CpaA
MIRILTTISSLGLAAAAWAQEAPGQTLPTDQAIPGLMFFTLFAGLAIAVGALIFFLRRRSNRAAMQRVLTDNDRN